MEAVETKPDFKSWDYWEGLLCGYKELHGFNAKWQFKLQWPMTEDYHRGIFRWWGIGNFIVGLNMPRNKHPYFVVAYRPEDKGCTVIHYHVLYDFVRSRELLEEMSELIKILPEPEMLPTLIGMGDVERLVEAYLKSCICGNPQMGFDCVCDWVRAHPGDNEYSCEFCGIYKASVPRCNKCEKDQ